MPRGIPNAKQASNLEAMIAAANAPAVNNMPPVKLDEMAAKPEPVKKFPVKLLYNYAPGGDYDIIGYHKRPVLRKNNAGQMVEIEAGGFIEGKQTPPPHPGVGFEGKVWKDTVIALPRDEAIALVTSKRAERADAFPA